MKQADLGLNQSTKRTRDSEFLDEMNRVLPLATFAELVAAHAREQDGSIAVRARDYVAQAFQIAIGHLGRTVQYTAQLVVLFSATVTQAQHLPPTSRTVYKCEVNGKVAYSDAPCIGAERLQVQPTRGLNKSTGREAVGADVRREISREQFADAVRPVTGMSPQQFQTAGLRQRLSAADQRSCRELDAKLPQLERAEREATPSVRPATQDELLKARAHFRALRC